MVSVSGAKKTTHLNWKSYWTNKHNRTTGEIQHGWENQLKRIHDQQTELCGRALVQLCACITQKIGARVRINARTLHARLVCLSLSLSRQTGLRSGLRLIRSHLKVTMKMRAFCFSERKSSLDVLCVCLARGTRFSMLYYTYNSARGCVYYDWCSTEHMGVGWTGAVLCMICAFGLVATWASGTNGVYINSNLYSAQAGRRRSFCVCALCVD